MKSAISVLLIDDEEKLRSLLSRILTLEGFQVREAGTCRSALQQLKQELPQVVLCDVKLPDGNGVDFCGELKSRYPALEIILLTAYGNIPDSVQAIKNGAFDYIQKGDENHKIIPLIYKAAASAKTDQALKVIPGQKTFEKGFGRVVGNSAVIATAKSLAEKVAPTEATVLLTGETGTGKEIFAKALHEASGRKSGPFVAINCAAFSKELLESELFGHTAGAFTGALKDQIGLFEAAAKGTLFLDEIGELVPELQSKLLRVLESGEYHKIGSTKTMKADVRIVAATNKNLKDGILKGQFREDLYFRIAVFEIQLPPLRERIEDIELLVTHFLQYWEGANSIQSFRIAADALNMLKAYPWPGNIRELKNTIERAIILCDDHLIEGKHFLPEIQKYNLTSNQKELSAFELASAEKLHIQKVLNHTKGNKTKASELLGIALTTLYRKMAEYGIE